MKFLLSTLLASIALPAFAADMPLKAPIQQRPAYIDWSGFYVGAHGGYGWGHDEFTDPFFVFNGNRPDLILTNTKSKGFVFGGQVGHNWQWGGWVGGIEVDLSTTGIKGSTRGSVSQTQTFGTFFIRDTETVTEDDKFNLLGSARGRIGPLLGQNFLIYVTGGPAWTEFTHGTSQTFRRESNFPPTAVDQFTSTFTDRAASWRFGFAVGVGGEYRLTENLFLGVEYLHYDFGKSREEFSNSFSVVGGTSQASANTADRLTVDAVRGRLSWKFTGGPTY